MALTEQTRLKTRFHYIKWACYNCTAHSSKTRTFVKTSQTLVRRERRTYPPATKCLHDFAGRKLVEEVPALFPDIVLRFIEELMGRMRICQTNRWRGTKFGAIIFWDVTWENKLICFL